MSVTRALADPRVRLGAGTAVLLVTATAARRNRVGPDEAAAFRAVNDLPGWLYPPAWVVKYRASPWRSPGPKGSGRRRPPDTRIWPPASPRRRTWSVRGFP
jgi:hypothetical protein